MSSNVNITSEYIYKDVDFKACFMQEPGIKQECTKTFKFFRIINNFSQERNSKQTTKFCLRCKFNFINVLAGLFLISHTTRVFLYTPSFIYTLTLFKQYVTLIFIMFIFKKTISIKINRNLFSKNNSVVGKLKKKPTHNM